MNLNSLQNSRSRSFVWHRQCMFMEGKFSWN